MSEPIVYRSRDPEVVAAWKAAGERVHAYVAATRAVLDEEGFGGYEAFRHDGGWTPGRFAGLAIPQDEFAPKGWRPANSDGCSIPDKRTAAGKRIAQRMSAIKHPGDPRNSLTGMPADVMIYGGRFILPGVRLLEDGRALYLIWKEDPAGHKQSFFSKTTDIDPALWERVKLSEYYAEVECVDAAETAVAS